MLVGTLNHCTLVVPQGRSHLPTFYSFLASFSSNPNRNIKHTISPSLALEAAWWQSTLANPWCGLRIKAPPTPLPIEVCVDASSSWGIGFIMEEKWLVPLIPGWHSDKRDIGWAEMVAVELVLSSMLASTTVISFYVQITPVLSVLSKPMSCNSQ